MEVKPIELQRRLERMIETNQTHDAKQLLLEMIENKICIEFQFVKKPEDARKKEESLEERKKEVRAPDPVTTKRVRPITKEVSKSIPGTGEADKSLPGELSKPKVDTDKELGSAPGAGIKVKEPESAHKEIVYTHKKELLAQLVKEGFTRKTAVMASNRVSSLTVKAARTIIKEQNL